MSWLDDAENVKRERLRRQKEYIDRWDETIKRDFLELIRRQYPFEKNLRISTQYLDVLCSQYRWEYVRNGFVDQRKTLRTIVTYGIVLSFQPDGTAISYRIGSTRIGAGNFSEEALRDALKKYYEEGPLVDTFSVDRGPRRPF